ncbi:hypothetical protein L1887_12608 [Cichorium endivia]|nr:hypothetical protein L1887_12608 [Cichorium endivia]
MFEWVEKIVHKFWQPLGKYVRMHRREDENASNGHWSKDLEPHAFGEYSYATRDIEPTDRFIIFASDGLWEHLANQEAVDIVRKSTDRRGVAKKLIKKALKVAAKKQHRSYRSVRRLAPGLRRPVHDDISVIVLFIDHNLMERSAQVEEVSVKAFAETTESEFKYIYGGASTSAAGPSTSAAGPRTSAVGASTSAVGASASADDGASTSGPKASTSAGGKNTAEDGSSSSSE